IRSSLMSPQRSEGRVDQGTTPVAIAETKEPQWSRGKWGMLQYARFVFLSGLSIQLIYLKPDLEAHFESIWRDWCRG
ncbi:MAG: hypothetical protein ACKO9Z_14985, partial [Planctomycetota bacterium]